MEIVFDRSWGDGACLVSEIKAVKKSNFASYYIDDLISMIIQPKNGHLRMVITLVMTSLAMVNPIPSIMMLSLTNSTLWE